MSSHGHSRSPTFFRYPAAMYPVFPRLLFPASCFPVPFAILLDRAPSNLVGMGTGEPKGRREETNGGETAGEGRGNRGSLEALSA